MSGVSPVSNTALAFIAESNRIEGINRGVTEAELEAHQVILASHLTVADVEAFVGVVAGAPMRRYSDQNVRVGSHRPIAGGPHVERELAYLLEAIRDDVLTPYDAHQQYEHLHPFMDGNGRSGRAVWAWHMLQRGQDPFALPFLHRWYYQSLDAARGGAS